MGIERICCALLLAACGLASAQSIQDYATALGAKGGYDVATKPKIRPDTAVYSISGDIEITDGPSAFIARHKRPRFLDPWANQLMRELNALSDQSEEPYFAVHLPKHLLSPFNEYARLNGSVVVVGRYTNNIDLELTNGTVRKYPIFTAIALEIEGKIFSDHASTQLAKVSFDLREARSAAKAPHLQNYAEHPAGEFVGNFMGDRSGEPHTIYLTVKASGQDQKHAITIEGGSDGCGNRLSFNGVGNLSSPGSSHRALLAASTNAGACKSAVLRFTTGRVDISLDCEYTNSRGSHTCPVRAEVKRSQ